MRNNAQRVTGQGEEVDERDAQTYYYGFYYVFF